MQQAALLQVRLRNAPAAPQILEDSILQIGGERLRVAAQRPAVDAHVACIGVLRKRQGRTDGRGNRQVGERLTGWRGHDGSGDGGAQQAHPDEIVKMPRLQRGILPVIGEAEQLLCAGEQVRAAHLIDGRDRDQRGRRAAPLAAEASELAKVVLVAPRVDRPAAQASQERRR